jgi:hypothetical protein
MNITIIAIFGGILLASFIMAFRSMKDFEVPDEIKKILLPKTVKGTIVFFKNKVTHYSSTSSSSP